MEKEIARQYRRANKELKRKWDEYLVRGTKRIDVLEKELDTAIRGGDNDEITSAKKALQEAKMAYTLRNNNYREMVSSTARGISGANEAALAYVNGQIPSVYSVNYNQVKDVAQLGGIDFNVVNEDVIKRRVTDGTIKLPEKKLNVEKDKRWNMKQMNSAVLQGILQGEAMPQIAKRIDKIIGGNKSSAISNARTLVTQAECQGRQDSYERLTKEGAILKKQWLATGDKRTRVWHDSMDGDEVDIDEDFTDGIGNKLKFPGDPSAPAVTVYNCRCTMTTRVIGFRKKDGSIKYLQEPADDFKWNKKYVGKEGRKFGKADTSDALAEIKDGNHNSLEEWLDADGNLSPERAALHRQIIDNYLAEKLPQQGQATMTMMGGGPASGKSSALKMGLYKMPDKKYTVTVDPDDIKTYLPGYLERAKVDSGAAGFYHEESSMLAKQLANTCFTENFNVTYDGTGDGSVGSVMKKINGAREKGYEVNGMYVTIDTDEALRRNQKRYDDAKARGESPRKPKESYVIDCHRKVTEISMEVSDQFDSISLFDNNGKEGETKLIAVGGKGKKLTAVKGEEEAFQRFLDKVNYGKPKPSLFDDYKGLDLHGLIDKDEDMYDNLIEVLLQTKDEDLFLDEYWEALVNGTRRNQEVENVIQTVRQQRAAEAARKAEIEAKQARLAAERAKTNMPIPELSSYKKGMRGNEYDEYMEVVKKSEMNNVYAVLGNDIKRVTYESGSGYAAGTSILYCTNPSQIKTRPKYSILAHESGHAFDATIRDRHLKDGSFKWLTFDEIETINRAIRPEPYATYNGKKFYVEYIKKRASASDEYLAAMRKDWEAFMSRPDKGKWFSDMDKLPIRDQTVGIQDLYSGMTTRRIFWGHSSEYFNETYNDDIYKADRHREVKQAYLDMGFDASNQTKVKALVRQYTAALELWANQTDALTNGGEALEIMDELMPETMAVIRKFYREVVDELT